MNYNNIYLFHGDKMLCKNCEKKLDNENRLFCSFDCLNKYRKKYHPNRSGCIKKCLFCGNKFYISKSRLLKKFCSNECYNKSRKINKNHTSNYKHYKRCICFCFGCGKELSLRVSEIKQGKKYCSQKCLNEHIKKYEEISSNYRNTKIIKSCIFCEKEFKTSVIQNKKYCSLKCYHQDPASPNRQYGLSNAMTKEINREKVRKKILEYIKNNPKGKIMIGKNEKYILDKIENIYNIKIVRGYEISGYVVDGYCEDLNIVFEIDEEYHRYQKDKDLKRERIIKDKLNCKFIRINDRGTEYDYQDVSIGIRNGD